MTEDEAKTKWCPFRRGVEQWPSGVTIKIGEPCIASACMAWRWGQTAGEGPFSIDYGTGYCGLAGSRKP